MYVFSGSNGPSRTSGAPRSAFYAQVRSPEQKDRGANVAAAERSYRQCHRLVFCALPRSLNDNWVFHFSLRVQQFRGRSGRLKGYAAARRAHVAKLSNQQHFCLQIRRKKCTRLRYPKNLLPILQSMDFCFFRSCRLASSDCRRTCANKSSVRNLLNTHVNHISQHFLFHIYRGRRHRDTEDLADPHHPAPGHDADGHGRPGLLLRVQA